MSKFVSGIPRTKGEEKGKTSYANLVKFGLCSLDKDFRPWVINWVSTLKVGTMNTTIVNSGDVQCPFCLLEVDLKLKQRRRVHFEKVDSRSASNPCFLVGGT